MSRKSAMNRRNSISRNRSRSLTPIRAAVEAMEPRVLLSTYVVNTFVDQIDASSSTTVSLRDAIAKAAAHAGRIRLTLRRGITSSRWVNCLSTTRAALLRFKALGAGDH